MMGDPSSGTVQAGGMLHRHLASACFWCDSGPRTIPKNTGKKLCIASNIKSSYLVITLVWPSHFIRCTLLTCAVTAKAYNDFRVRPINNIKPTAEVKVSYTVKNSWASSFSWGNALFLYLLVSQWCHLWLCLRPRFHFQFFGSRPSGYFVEK